MARLERNGGQKPKPDGEKKHWFQGDGVLKVAAATFLLLLGVLVGRIFVDFHHVDQFELALGFICACCLVLMLSPLLQAKRFRILAGRIGERTLRGAASAFFVFVPKRSREHLMGDLEEEYRADIVPSRGWVRAWCWWWRQVLGIAGPYIWQRVTRVLRLEVVLRWRRR